MKRTRFTKAQIVKVKVLQQQKIEELTLYAIEQEQKSAAQQQLILEQKKKREELFL